MLAAGWLRLPTLIHEQNAVLGRANRLLARRVRCIATAFDRVEALPAGADRHVERTGNPVRPSIAAVRHTPYAAPEPEGAFRLLVIGGSQGARVFSETVPPAPSALPAPPRTRVPGVAQRGEASG